MEHDVETRTIELDGSYDQRRDVVQGGKSGKATLPMPLDVSQIIEFLKMAVNGGATGAKQGADDAWLWSFEPAASLKTATIEWDDANKEWELPYSMVDEIKFSGEVGGTDVNVDVSVIGKNLVETTMTSGIADWTPNIMQGWEVALLIDAFGTEPATSIASTLIKWEYTIKNNLKQRYFGDNIQTPGGVSRSGRTVDAKITLDASTEGNAEFANWLATTKRNVGLMLGNNTVIDGAVKEYVKLIAPGAWTSSKIGEEEGSTIWELEFENIYDPTLGYGFKIDVMNARSS